MTRTSPLSKHFLQPKATSRLQRGFSLVEIALVLVITGIALGAGLTLLNSKLAQSRIDSTKVKTEAVRVALVNYVGQNFRMPCPADPLVISGVANYNVERRNAAPVGAETCIASGGLINNVGGAAPLGVSRGTVPCTTLGLPEDTCIDAWGARLTYFVQNTAIRLTRDTVSGMRGGMTVHTVVPPAAVTVTAGLAPTGNQINACSATAGDNSCNLAAVAMIISHGANRGGGFPPTSGVALPAAVGVNISAYEAENTNNNVQFIQNNFIEALPNAFDDILVAVVPRDIVSSLNQTGIVKQPNVFMSERFELVKQVLLANAYANATPTGTTRTLQLSAPAGTAVNYTFTTAISSFTPCITPTNTLALPTPTIAALTTGSGGGIWRDAWNNPIRYVRAVNSVGNNNTCTTPFVLLSYGPDGVPSPVGGDDLFLPVTKQEIDAFVAKYGGY